MPYCSRTAEKILRTCIIIIMFNHIRIIAWRYTLVLGFARDAPRAEARELVAAKTSTTVLDISHINTITITRRNIINDIECQVTALLPRFLSFSYMYMC